MKFTQNLKDVWLENLKNGSYRQTQDNYIEYSKDGGQEVGHCCLAVYDRVNKRSNWSDIPMDWKELVKINDEPTENFVPDYSNVIPTIESLPVVSDTSEEDIEDDVDQNELNKILK